VLKILATTLVVQARQLDPLAAFLKDPSG